MIEINLLPGSVKRTKRKGGGAAKVAMPKINIPPMDKYLLISIGLTVLSVLLIAYMQIGGKRKLEAVRAQHTALVADTVRLHTALEMSAMLAARQDTIGQKLTVIQDLDAGRYNLAHIMDEVARTVPDYTWIVALTPADGGDANTPAFRIEGRMGNAFALPKFLTELENSPFITDVSMKRSAPVVENQKPMYSFVIEAKYEHPSADLIRTVPLFGPGMELDSAVAAKVLVTPDGTTATDAASAAAAVNAAAAARSGNPPAAPKTAPKPAPGKTPPAAVKKAGN